MRLPGVLAKTDEWFNRRRWLLGLAAVICVLLMLLPALHRPTSLDSVRWITVYVLMIAVLSKRRIADLLVALTVITGFAPINLGAVTGFVAFAPLIYLMRLTRSNRQAAVSGLLLGVGEMLCLMTWAGRCLSHPTTVILLAAAYLGSLWAIASWAMYKLSNVGITAMLVIPAVDWIRAHNPLFPSGHLLSPQLVASNHYAVQSVEVLGFYGLSLAISAGSWVAARGRWRCMVYLIVALVGVNAFGFWRLLTVTERLAATRITVGVVQKDNPVSVGGKSASVSAVQIIGRIRSILASGHIDLLILPEAMVLQTAPTPPGVTREISADDLTENDVRHVLAEISGGPPPAIVGLEIETADDNFYRNTAEVFAADPQPLPAVDKAIAAPLLEGRPLPGLAWLAEEPGCMVTEFPNGHLTVPGVGKFSVTFCNEHVLPQAWALHYDGADTDAGIILANLRWVGYSAGEREQSRAARILHAVERRQSIMYVANGGSEWIDAVGTVHDALSPKAVGGIWTVVIGRPQSGRLSDYIRELHSAFAPVTIGVIILSAGIQSLARYKLHCRKKHF